MEIPKRISDFEDKAFGMFVHWGAYSVLGRGEWAKNICNIGDEEYDELARGFEGRAFDAEKLVMLAKNAGMKYITFTARHHDGFSLYDTKGLSDYDSMHSRAKRDFVREFVDACNKHDIMPILYHTTLDWHNKDFEKDFDSYLEYLRRSVELLCTNYGKIGGLWFDGNWSKPDADWKLDELYGTIRKYQKDALIINNTGLNARGDVVHPEIDSVTFEQGLPRPMDREGKTKYITGEMCYTINNHWGYGAGDINYKSPAHLIETLCNCRKAGANFLLNIGPDGDGNIPPMMSAILLTIGEWMKINHFPVYHARPCEVLGDDRDFALKAPDGKMYLFVFSLPVTGDGNVTLTDGSLETRHFKGLNKKIKSIKWLDDNREINFEQSGDEVSLFPTGFPYGTQLVVRVAEVQF